MKLKTSQIFHYVAFLAMINLRTEEDVLILLTSYFNSLALQ